MMPGNETVYKSPRAFLPMLWVENNLTQGTDNDAPIAGAPTGLADVPMAQAGSVTAIMAAMSQPITNDREITVALRKNGTVTTNIVVVAAADGTTRVGVIPPGQAVFAVGDTVGIRISAGSGLTPNALIDIVVWLEYQNI